MICMSRRFRLQLLLPQRQQIDSVEPDRSGIRFEKPQDRRGPPLFFRSRIRRPVRRFHRY